MEDHVRPIPAANSNAGISFGAYLLPQDRNTTGVGGLPGGIAQTKRKPRALVVDDAPDVLEMLAILLRHEGYEVLAAASGAEALQAAEAELVDIVVSDIGMPDMDGYHLALALRTLSGYQAIPFVAVTGFAMYDDRERALESGFNAHLTKPINPMTFLDLLARLQEHE